MDAKVTSVLSDTVVRIDRRWDFHGTKGTKVRILGLLPSGKQNKEANKRSLRDLLLHKQIELVQPHFVEANCLSTTVEFQGKPVPSYLPEERRIEIVDPSRWNEPDETEPIEQVAGGIPAWWQNPIMELPLEKAPYFGNMCYPTRYWDRDFETRKKIADKLYSDTHGNKEELDRWFKTFLTSPTREAPLMVVGPVGIGKSWYVSRALMDLPRDKYHIIVIDLRSTPRGSFLAQAIEEEFHEHLNHYVTDLSWLHDDFRARLGEDFDPEDEDVKRRMQEHALSLSPTDLNHLRLRYYNRPGAPELLIAFDNIDHYGPEEQETIVDICRRIVGLRAGVKFIITHRPTTITLKDRMRQVFGDAMIRSVHLTSPEAYDVIERRLTTNNVGDSWSLDDAIPKAKGNVRTWRELLETYKASNHEFGVAGFLMALCVTSPVRSTEGDGNKGNTVQRELPLERVSYDLRFYLKLFRRIVRSNRLESLANVSRLYYGIHALMLQSTENANFESESYLFNLFDNEEPGLPGNALIRYRVLEYFKIFEGPVEGIFDVFFSSMGITPARAWKVAYMFEAAGLVEIDRVYSSEGAPVPVAGRLTVPGRRHFEIVTNLWYIICAKTSMHMYKEFILYNREAREAAAPFVWSDRVLAYYAKHGWVPEKKFIRFIVDQEVLEGLRIGRYQKEHPEHAEITQRNRGIISWPGANLWYGYRDQLERWQRFDKGQRTGT